MDSKTLGFAGLPLADVRLPVVALPDAIAMFDAHEPLSIVDLAVLPSVDSFAIGLASFEITMVVVARSKEFVASPVSLVVAPLSLVYSPGHVDENTKALTLPFFIQLTTIDATIFVLLDAKMITFANRLVIEFIAYHFVLFNRIAVVFKLPVLFARRPESFLHQLFVNFDGHFGLPPAPKLIVFFLHWCIRV